MKISIKITADKLAAQVILRKAIDKSGVNAQEIAASLAAQGLSCQLSLQAMQNEIEQLQSQDESERKFKIYHDSYQAIVGCFNVQVAEDEQKAFIDVNVGKESCGRLKEHILERILKEQGVIHGILLSRLSKLVNKYNKKPGAEHNLLIAQGESEIIAADGYLDINPLLDKKTEINRTIREKGQTVLKKYPARVSKTSIAKNTVLITKYLPIFGRKGFTVSGKVLWSKNNKSSVKDPRIAVSKNIEEVEFPDRIQYRSMVRGIAYFINNTILEAEEVLDGKFEISFSEDKMRAFISLQSPKGGDLIKPDEVLHDIKQKKITASIDKSQLIQWINRVNTVEVEKIEREPLAEGVPPENGFDAQVLWNINLEMYYKPKILADGSVDFRWGNRFPFVKKDQKAGLWILSTEGRKDGYNVLGDVIKPLSGQEIEMQWNDFFDFEDTIHKNRPARVLIPKVSGLLVKKGNFLRIEPVLELKMVDYATGNIDFDGTVMIKEGIAEGFSVRSSQDIIVKSGVGPASLQAAGNIIIEGGVSGKAVIRARGDVKVKYVENAVIKAKSVYVHNFALLSRLYAKDAIVIGSGKTKGKLIGGESVAWNTIKVNFIGSEKSVADAQLLVGIASEVQQRRQENEKKIRMLHDEISNLKSNQAKGNQTADLEKTREEAITRRVEELNKLVEQNQDLFEQLYNPDAAMVQIVDKAQAHTSITIGPQVQKLMSSVEKSNLRLVNNRIVVDKNK